MTWHHLLSESLRNKFEFYNYGHAVEILTQSFPSEWQDLQNALSQLEIPVKDIIVSGGNESPIPKKFDDVLYPLGWREIRITGDLLIKKYPRLTNKKKR